MAALPVAAADAYGQPDTNDMSAPEKGPQVGKSYALPELPQQELKRRKRIGDARKAYEGDWGAGPLKVKPGDPDKNVRPNMCQPIVDVGVNFLFGEVVKIEIANDTDSETGAENEVDNGAEEGTSPAQAFLDDCWGDDDDKMTLLTKLAMNGALAGNAFVLLDPSPKGKRKGRASGKVCPRIILLNPSDVHVIPDPHDCENVQEFWVQYEVETYNTLGQPEVYTYRKVIKRNDPDGLASITGEGYDEDDTWIIEDYMRKGAAGVAARNRNNNSLFSGQQGQGADWTCIGRTDWPKPWPPIIGCQNLPNPNEYEGLPDLTKDLIQMNRALIFNESNIAITIENYVAPPRWASGVTANNMSLSPDSILLFQSSDAKLQALDVKADLQNAMAFSERLQSAMDEQSQIPGLALGRMKDLPKGQISGTSLRALYKPPMSKTTKKRRLYGRLIREVSQRMLELGDFTAAAEASIQLNWKDPMPNDDLTAAQAAQILHDDLGVSQDSLMQQFGFNPDVEADKRQDEEQRKVVAFSQGQGLPPMPANMPPDGANGQTDDAQQQPQPQPGPPQKPGNVAALNSPKAQQMRATMKQMAGS
jgi:hypothetical protein